METDELILLLAGQFLAFDNICLSLMWNFIQTSFRRNRRLHWMMVLDEDHSMTPKIAEMPQWVINLNNIYFYKLFRMERSTFHMFLESIRMCDKNKLLNVNYRGGHYPIGEEIQALVFLKYMSSQDTLLTIGNSFKISPASVMNIINKILYFVLKLKKHYIKFPKTPEELNSVCTGFQKYPGTIGAIDGTHVNITIDPSQQDSYIDRYRQHSINVMLICDKNKLFTYTFVGFPGSAHDSRVFEHSAFYKTVERLGANHLFQDDDKYHLIGDSAFPLKKWLMTPYRDTSHLTARERKHNNILSSERVVIEHAIGLWKARWPRLHFIKTYNISKTIEIASAACVLHNFCLLNDDQWVEEENNSQTDHGHVFTQASRTQEYQEAKTKRDRIAQQLNEA